MVAALAAVYAGVVAVSIVVAAYSVYFKVAYWGNVHSVWVEPDVIKVTEVEIEHEVLIDQIDTFFKD